MNFSRKSLIENSWIRKKRSEWSNIFYGLRYERGNIGEWTLQSHPRSGGEW